MVFNRIVSFQCGIYCFDYALIDNNTVYLILKLCKCLKFKQISQKVMFLFKIFNLKSLKDCYSNRAAFTLMQNDSYCVCCCFIYDNRWLPSRQEYKTVNTVNASHSEVLCILSPGVTSTVNLGAAAPVVVLHFYDPFTHVLIAEIHLVPWFY